ncbi:hydroxyethylthiazole kinase [Alkalicoccus daliensis]|nr:hydroxyethylthiazole kinase [Alkalicoccus daliensis]
MRESIKENSPLIHNITNVVVTNFTANGLYALGASPVMAYAMEEVEDMAKIAKALVLNIGTLTRETNEAMLAAGRTANAHGVPVVLDPVGAGATPFRTESAKMLLNELQIAVIRGNAGEIANLSDSPVPMQGVDSRFSSENEKELAVQVAKEWNTVVCMTGENDIITDGETHYVVSNGDKMLTKVTGAGCLLSSVTGAFLTLEESPLDAAAAACIYYGIAAEKAASRQHLPGPGHFQMNFLDMLDELTEAEIKTYMKFKKEEIE